MLILLFLACSNTEPATDSGPITTDTTTVDTSGTGTGTTTGTTATGTGSTMAAMACDPLPAATGNTATVSPGDNVQAAVDALSTGDTLLFQDGVYDLDGAYIWVSTPGITLRGESGVAANVVLDGGFSSTEILTIAAADVTVTDLTFYRAWTHGVHVVGGGDNVVLHRIDVLEPGQQAIKVNPSNAYCDNGVLSCSRMIMTSEARDNAVRDNCYTGGLDMHQSRGWVIRDNYAEGFWCDQGLSEHGIHLWRTNAESLITRNTVVNCARGIGIGLTDSAIEVRDYGIAGCDQGAGYFDDIRGTIVNNMVIADDPGLFASNSGFDSGIGVYQACEATVQHNTVYSTQTPFSSLEWRFEGTTGTIDNNLVSHNLRERTPGTATFSGNIENADASHFVSASSRDLHLEASSAAVDAGVATSVTHDIDNDLRDNAPDVGADERL